MSIAEIINNIQVKNTTEKVLVIHRFLRLNRSIVVLNKAYRIGKLTKQR